jgi:glycosyltransferase involved in cell wall biosynthesis
MKNESFVSVVMVTENDAGVIGTVLRELHAHLAEHFVDYEIVIVDQRSGDATRAIVDALLTVIPSMRFIELAYPVSHDVAVAAALENAIGDFIVIFAPRNDPCDCIAGIVKQCREGSDIVVGISPPLASVAYRCVRPLMHRLLAAVGYDVPRNATELRCLSRRAVNAVTRAGRFHHQLFVRIQKTGYPFSTYVYQQIASGERKTLVKGMREAFRLLVFNSTRPLRWMTAVGIVASFCAFVVAFFGLLAGAFAGSVASWAAILMFVSVMFAIMFSLMAFFGEYLGRLLDDRGEQNLYSVVHEKISSVVASSDRVNVLTESVLDLASYTQNIPPDRRQG